MKPQYISPNCPNCNEPLMLADLLDNPAAKPEDILTDEWACPECYDGDGVYIDFDPEEQAELERRVKDIEDGTAKTIPWEEVKRDTFYEGMTEEEIAKREKEIEQRVKKMIEEDDFPKTRRILNFD